MGTKSKIKLLVFLAVLILGGAGVYLHGVNIPVLQPRGPIAQKERGLIITAVLLSLIVVIPVYVMLVGFAWKFREGNKQAVYRPNFDHSRLLETIWWGVPLIIILILGTITWYSSRDLDPFKPLSAARPPLTIQAISLQWKWLFIYPQQNIASVNFIQIPVDTPIAFEITSDAPMNSFWIPQLGGQIYAMSGMSTQLHLMATQAGTYRGSSANISGQGFAGMHFEARAGSDSEFNNWLETVRTSSKQLDTKTYSGLTAASPATAVSYYGWAQSGLYENVISKYLAPVYFRPPAEAQ